MQIIHMNLALTLKILNTTHSMFLDLNISNINQGISVFATTDCRSQAQENSDEQLKADKLHLR